MDEVAAPLSGERVAQGLKRFQVHSTKSRIPQFCATSRGQWLCRHNKFKPVRLSVNVTAPARKRGSSLTSEQLEAARAERLRQNGLGTLTFEDARTWIEETGLCLFLPRRQFATSVSPTFVEAVVGQRDATPDPRHIATAEAMLVRLELEGIAVRLNLLGQPGEQPDFVVAAWVLPYVYALRGDRDWRRIPQLTGSRAVSPLAVQAYKLLEAGDSTISHLKQALGREVSEAAVVRAITELWQQLRIIPVIAAPGQPAKWQLLRHRFQKAIAEGASTSQVTAISVLASIYLQAVIAASMEEVEIFLSPLTARSKVREVLRGLVATRQVHTIALGHAPHFYVAGTLPEFSPATSLYGNTTLSASFYLHGERDERSSDRFDTRPSYYTPAPPPPPAPAPDPQPEVHVEAHSPRVAPRKPAPAPKPAASRPHFSRPAPHKNDRKHASNGRASQSTGTGRFARRGSEARNGSAHATNGSRPASAARWSQGAAKSTNGNGAHAHKNGAHSNGKSAHATNGSSSLRNRRPAASSWGKSASSGKLNGHTKGLKSKNGSAPSAHKAAIARKKDARTSARGNRKPELTAGAKAGNAKKYGFTARPGKGTKKRG